ncbi:Uncharacterised protein [Mycobacteroides abscessus]|nr:Uncharacterised protein [Mycobacteroides abscessus]
MRASQTVPSGTGFEPTTRLSTTASTRTARATTSPTLRPAFVRATPAGRSARSAAAGAVPPGTSAVVAAVTGEVMVLGSARGRSARRVITSEVTLTLIHAPEDPARSSANPVE